MANIEIESDIGLTIELDLPRIQEPELWAIIRGPLLQAEVERYPLGNSAEHKLLFLVGPPKNDVSVALTSKGEPIYSKPQHHVKLPEITEATAAISFHFEVEPNIVRVLSEVTDVIFNLAVLTELDIKFAQDYATCIDQIATSLGMSVQDALLLAAAKFYYRLVKPGVKNTKAEDELISKLISDKENRPPRIKPPTDDHINSTFRILNRMARQILETRLGHLQYWSFYDG